MSIQTAVQAILLGIAFSSIAVAADRRPFIAPDIKPLPGAPSSAQSEGSDQQEQTRSSPCKSDPDDTLGIGCITPVHPWELKGRGAPQTGESPLGQ